MEKEFNIAAILKDKPKGTKLWSPISGDCKYEYLAHNSIDVWFQGLGIIMLSKKGKWSQYGETIIFPSKSMRDWSKFAWKKGDVLRFSDILVVFEKWTKDDYTEFKASYEYNCHSDSFDKGNVYYTSEFCKAIDEAADNFIKKVEEHYGGKLNLSTLEIEQPKQEFKDGDIVEFGESVAIYKKFEEDKLYFYACIDAVCGLFLSDSVETSSEYRLATDSEKQQLFDALAKGNKAWNAEKKMLVDLPKKCGFEPMDWCLMRRYSCTWELCQFAYQEANGNRCYHTINGAIFHECIPYNDQTAHLLGTTDEWKGGEG